MDPRKAENRQQTSYLNLIIIGILFCFFLLGFNLKVVRSFIWHKLTAIRNELIRANMNRRGRVLIYGNYSAHVVPLRSLLAHPINFTIHSQNAGVSSRETRGPCLDLETPGSIQASVGLPIANNSAIFFEFLMVRLPFHANITLGLAPKDDTGSKIPGDRVGCLYDRGARKVCFILNDRALPPQELPVQLVEVLDLRPTFHSDLPCTIRANIDKFNPPSPEVV